MASTILVPVLALALGASGFSGDSNKDSNFIDNARARYYSLSAHGFESMECKVKFEVGDFPLPLLPMNDRQEMAKVVFPIVINHRGAVIRHEMPSGLDMSEQHELEVAANWVQGLVQGTFKTWPSKGIDGPIPPYAGWLREVETTPDGYRIDATEGNRLNQIVMTKDFVVTNIVSAGGRVEEQPHYRATEAGLVYAGLSGVEKDPGGDVHIRYDVDTAEVDGYIVPGQIHLVVTPNVDLRFNLTGCHVHQFPPEEWPQQ